MTQLVLYESARSALAEARRIDEVKDIRDKAEAMRAYGRMANDVQLEMDAADLRLRAERRLGIMLAEEKQAGRLRTGPGRKGDIGTEKEPIVRVTLEDIGIDKKLSARAQKVGGIAERAFEAMVARTRQRIADGAGKVSLDLSTEDKKERRAIKEKVLAGMQSALPDKRYGVIYADPEWRFEVYSRDTGMDRSADNHYPTTATDAICARPVQDIAADDCVLFLWATVPMLLDALKVMAAWGFAYKSQTIWNKDRLGTGYWFRNKHELLLVGTRGDIPAPAMGTQWPSVIYAPVGKHSAKPDTFYELIESYFPNLPKIELNARRTRAGWDAWGLEAPATADGASIEHDADGVIPDDDAQVIARLWARCRKRMIWKYRRFCAGRNRRRQMRDYDPDEINKAFDDIASASTPEARTEAIAEARKLCLRELDALIDDDGWDEESSKDGIIDAVNSLLDEVKRPVGKLTFTVPATPAVDRALLRLHDVVCRSL